jgi:hypothetical protein
MTSNEKCKSIYWNLIELLESRKYNKHRDTAIFRAIEQTDRCDHISNLSNVRHLLYRDTSYDTVTNVTNFATTEYDKTRITSALNTYSPEITRALAASLPIPSRIYYHTIYRQEQAIVNFFDKLKK